MPRISVYEAEPGDWRFDEEHWGYYCEVTDEELAELRTLNEARKKLNRMLRDDIKLREVDMDWGQEAHVSLPIPTDEDDKA